MFALLERLQGSSTLFSELSADTLIWGVFYILLAIWAIHGLVLLYHWVRYGGDYAPTWIVMVVHVGVSLTIIGIMFGAALAIT